MKQTTQKLDVDCTYTLREFCPKTKCDGCVWNFNAPMDEVTKILEKNRRDSGGWKL